MTHINSLRVRLCERKLFENPRPAAAKSMTALDQGTEAAREIYKYLRHLGISNAVAFPAALERCRQFCPDLPSAEIEAAVWRAVQELIREEQKPYRPGIPSVPARRPKLRG